jgi:acetyltransferase-like isoleucine patch superfamily enzyme
MSFKRNNLRDLEKFSYSGKGNSMRMWYQVKNPLRIALNFIIISLCKIIPSLYLKNILYRSLGMKIGKDVSIGLGAMLDIFFPELIEIGDNSIIGQNVTIIAHEFLIDKWRTGKVKIGKNAMIGINSTIIAGVTIGDNSRVSACSFVNRNVKTSTLVEGVPIKTVNR